jgi:hypothetical protein
MDVMELQIKGLSFLAENFQLISMTLSTKVLRANLPEQPIGVFTGTNESD